MKTPRFLFLLFALLTMAVFAGDKTYSYNYELQRGWNMIGVFLAPSVETQNQLEAYQFYEYSTQGNLGVFSRVSEITAGKSYWLYWEDEAKELTIEGTMIDGLTMKSAPTDPEGAYDLTETVFAGNEITRTAADVAGYKFTGWSATGVSLDDAAAQTISFIMPANDVTLFPNYEKISYHWLTVDGNASWKRCGEALSVTATSKTGYTFSNWTVEGVSVSKTTANPITFTMPANDVTLTSNYTANKYTLTVNGTSSQVSYRTTVTETAPAKSGYDFTNWTVSGVTVEDTSATTISFTMPANAVTLTANYEEAQEGGTYLVVNLSDGSYSYTDTAPDLSSDTCRTTELWLRRIPKGTFTMGSPEDEMVHYDDERQHKVTLTEDFYIGVFEMTQKQYELITGSRPSYFSNDDYYTTRPVEQVCYNDIRGSFTGAGWPSSHDVDSGSFLGKLRSKTGLTFDLPTEAQWEYACRAGTTTALNTGKNLTNVDEDGEVAQDSAMDEAGRYWYNGGSSYSPTCDTTAGTAKVGSYLPNNWGLYDMHGNVYEWCLDWWQEDFGSAAVTDPVGTTSGREGRVMRGGGWGYLAQFCRSANRAGDGYPFYGYYGSGFRVVLLPNYHALSVNGDVSVKKEGEIVTVTAEKEGCTFVGWGVDGVEIDDTSSQTLTFNMPANRVNLTGYYLPNRYTLTVGDVSTVECSGKEITAIAPEKAGYVFKNWSVKGMDLEEENNICVSFEMPDQDVSLKANYEKQSEIDVSTDYLVIDLTTGMARSSQIPPDLEDDACFTTELWLRHIPAGTFIMGSPELEMGNETWQASYDDNDELIWTKSVDEEELQHEVTISRDFYIGVFEMTQAQYELIHGEYTDDDDDYYEEDSALPIHNVSYNELRGNPYSVESAWPVAGQTIDNASFLGILRAKTGLTFDLPTEAQWEYACRAGVTTALNTGKSYLDERDAHFNASSKYEDFEGDEYWFPEQYTGNFMAHNSWHAYDNELVRGGNYNPNDWGLYDMHGNVAEWCLDRYCEKISAEAVTDPVGPAEGRECVVRGGSCVNYAVVCRSAARSAEEVMSSGWYTGFRVVLGSLEGKTLTVNNETRMEYTGSVLSIESPEREGYVFKNWTVSGVNVPDKTANPLVFTMPSANVTLRANYEIAKYSLTVDGEKSSQTYGSAVTVTAAEKSGLVFVGWIVQGELEDVDVSSETLSFYMPANDVTLVAKYLDAETLYLVVDLTTGKHRYSSTGPDLSNSTCRTKELWLRHVPAGTFTMGAPVGEKGQEGLWSVYGEGERPHFTEDGEVIAFKDIEKQHQVTLTEDFYIGVFEMTWAQCRLIYGSEIPEDKFCSDWDGTYGSDAEIPQSGLKYSFLKGEDAYTTAGLPAYCHRVTETSFLGKLRARTGLTFDLPTEAQWEYACRAGCSTSLNTGKNLTNFEYELESYSPEDYEDDGEWAYGGKDCIYVPSWRCYEDSAMDITGLYTGNSETVDYEPTTGGSFAANAWGLCDMHGNVYELCLDWFEVETPFCLPGDEAVTDPLGASIPVGMNPFLLDTEDSNSDTPYCHIYRGGDVDADAGECRSAYRLISEEQSDPGRHAGFRLVVQDPEGYTVKFNDWSMSEKAGDKVTVAAPEKEGYTFKNWTVDGITVSDISANPLTFTMPAKNVVLTPNYQINTYTLTVNGKASKKTYGTEVSVSATSKSGKVFVGWSVNGILNDTDTSQENLSFSMPAHDLGLEALYLDSDTLYMVMDLTTGEYRYSSAGPNLADDTCRTAELWLRHVPAGTFTMGSPAEEVGRESNETQHQVTLTEDFYVGVFEITQAQYAYFAQYSFFYVTPQYQGDCLPADSVGLFEIRGGTIMSVIRNDEYYIQWTETFDGALKSLRNMTGLYFDLPTEAQWEYACRAGATTALNTGKNLTDAWSQDEAMDDAGRYSGNCDESEEEGPAKVGSYLPNAWGLHDMHGNVCEWCSDRYQEDLGKVSVTDPEGASNGSRRVIRGGCWESRPGDCRSAYRYGSSGQGERGSGFRLIAYNGETHALSVDGRESLERTGKTISVDVPEKTGYVFTEWTVSGLKDVDVAANPLVFTMPANDVVLTPNYKPGSYILTVDGVTSQMEYGTEVSAEAPAEKEDTVFSHWSERGLANTANISAPLDITANPLVFAMPGNDVTLCANYKKIQKYVLSVDGVEEQVNSGSSVSKTAPEKAGYTFTGWTVTGVTVEDPTAATISFTMPANAVTLTANYE